MSKKRAYFKERQQHILSILAEKGRITVQDLSREFDVSNVTIRNDLKELEIQGRLIRTHGGAIGFSPNTKEIPFSVRMNVHSTEKHRLAKKAATLIEDGEAIFIDGGTTAPLITHYLEGKRDLTIVTPSIEVASNLSDNPFIEIFIMGGFFKRESLSTLGLSSAQVIDEWNIRKAFYGAYGFTLEHGLTDVHPGFIEQKRYISKRAQLNIGMVDSSKWGKVSRDTFLKTENIDIIVTDKNSLPEMQNAIQQNGIKLLLS